MAGRRQKLKPEEVAEALRQSGGIASVAASKLNVAQHTVQRYARDYPECAEAQEEARQANLDLAEAKLIQNIRDGSNTAIIFYLKTQGKDRGYTERNEVTGQDGGPIQTQTTIDPSGLSDAALAELMAAKRDSGEV